MGKKFGKHEGIVAKNNYSTYQYHDIDQLIQTARRVGYDASYIQLSPGSLRVEVTTGALPRVQFIQKKIELSIEIRAAARKIYCTFLLILSRESFRLNGIEHEKNELYLVPPGSEVHIITGNFVDMLSFAVPRSLIVSQFSHEPAISRLINSSRVYLFRIDQASRNKLKACIKACTHQNLTPELQSDLEILLVDCLTEIVINNQPLKGFTPLGYREKRKSLLSTQEYISANFSQSIAISDLSQLAGVSTRTLERQYRSELGLSPLQYIRAYRMEVVRRALIKKEFKNEQISDIALANGFNHLGRFSRDFRRHFGLLPSEIRQLCQ